MGSTGNLVAGNDGSTASVTSTGELQGDLVRMGGDAHRGTSNDVRSCSKRSSWSKELGVDARLGLSKAEESHSED